MTIIQKISVSIVLVLFSIVLILELFIQPEYSFGDYPYFDHRGLFLLAAILVVVLITVGIMKLGEKLRWNAVPPIVFFVAASLAFIFLVPMVPVSDQATVFFLASNDLTDPFGYTAIYSNTIPTVLYVYGLLSLFGKTLWVPKIANMVLGLMTLILTAKVYGLLVADEMKTIEEGKRLFAISERKVLWLGAIILPVILYENHIYNEIPSVTLILLLLYLVMRNDDSIWIRILTVVVSCLQFVLRQTGIIVVFAAALYIFFYQKKRVYALIYFASVVLGYVLIGKLYTSALVAEGAKGFAIWSWVKMGVNEAEFGFQDNTHTYDVTFWDCVDRYKEYGLLKVLEIYAKKTFWIWGEGTYQSGRYGLGYPDNEYEYETIVTALISGSEDRKLRVLLNMVLRAQYLFYMFFALVGAWIARKKDKFSVFFLIICGFLCFYLIWEIKSRYLYGLYPVFLILAMYGWEKCDVSSIKAWIKKRNCRS